MVFGFIKALINAARHQQSTPPLTALASTALILLGIKRAADKEIQDERLEYCRECPVFNHIAKTCGTPPDNAGCWCYMPVKVKLPEASCWLRDHYPDMEDPEYGWPERLIG